MAMMASVRRLTRGRAPVVEPRGNEKQRRDQHAIEGGGGAGDVGPADEDRGPGDTDYAGDESEIGQESGMLAGWGCVRDEWLLRFFASERRRFVGNSIARACANCVEVSRRCACELA